ncbi:MAG: hypothetical protein ABMA26_13030 [Limisphaerales bacterium]
MSTPDSTPAPTPSPFTKSNLKLCAILALVSLVIAVAVPTILPPRWRPQLGVKNTGTNAVAFSFKGEHFVSQPGQTWQMRISAGDTLTVRAAQPPDAPALTVKMPERNPKPWSRNPIVQRWTAEVNADDPKNIRFENRRWEEITVPQRPSQPWP